MDVNPDKDFLFREVVVRDGEPAKLSVLSKRFANFNWPPTLFFDSKTWYWESQDALSMDEASNFGGKGIYTSVRPEPKTVEDFLTNSSVKKPEPEVILPTQYFVVGAMWGQEEGGRIDMLPEFLKRGYWQNGYEREKFSETFDKMRVGDRIAVKRLRGKGAKFMDILALGIIIDIDKDGWTVYVKWVIQIKERMIPLRGCVGTAYGPYTFNHPGADDWIHEIFSI